MVAAWAALFRPGKTIAQNSPEALKRAPVAAARAKKHHRTSAIGILKKDKFKEALRDASKRSKGPRLKGIE